LSAAAARPDPASREAGGDEPALGGWEIAALGLLVAFSLAVRGFRWWQTSLMFNDGPTFLGLAQDMAAGRWAEALAHVYHPLYPFFTLLAHFALPDWESAAAAVSIAAGGAAVLCFFFFARSAFGRRAGWIAAVFLAVQPHVVDGSSDIQSDGLYLALFLASMACLWRSAASPRAALAGWAGLFSGLAYLTRPEGIGVLLVGAALASLRVARRAWRPAAAAGWLAALFAGALLVMTPYLTFLRVEHGHWTLSQKKDVSKLFSLDTSPPIAATQEAVAAAREAVSGPVILTPRTSAVPVRVLSALAAVLAAAGNAVRPWFLALLLLGVALRRGRPGPTGEFVGLVVGVYAAVLFAQDYRYAYVDGRHALPPLVVAFGYVGVATPRIGELVLRGLARLRRAPVPGPRAATAAGLAIVVAVALGQAIRPERRGARADRAAAAWLRAQTLPEGAVAAPKGRLAYYAGRPYVSLYEAPRSGMLAYLRTAGVRFVILDDEKLARWPELAAAEGGALRPLHRAEDRGRWTAVFALVEPTAEERPAVATGTRAPSSGAP
jgi:4-amino-4-deoxy-L-arabinose transferase-like glycosyltransferase